MKCRSQSLSEKGITLVALVVTIIVLLILAGVTISLALNNNGIIPKAKEFNPELKSSLLTGTAWDRVMG